MTEAGRTVIAELPVPSRLGTPESAAFEEMVAVLNGISVELWHNEDFVVTAEAELAGFRAQEFRELMAFVAVVDGAIVGRVLAIFPSKRTQ
ncbi:hypothetical protein [Leifsonia poae]|uniref:hypothetical protein n=1 Tax=Leifsonia poae TaxID=110933 RepID=UPI001CC00AA3|nr:hypothetical protein [Leifsonia poae]